MESLEEVRKNIEKQHQMDAIKNELASYDYIGVKIATGVATKEEYAEQIAYCEELREQIRQMEGDV